jgi:N-acetylglutamate synthase-like GNAT family acetyltransferase
MSYTIRSAVRADRSSITSIVRAAGINPFGLHWPRFLVAEEDGRVIGVAQVKPHGDGSRELASLAAIPERRGQGVGSALVGAILASETGRVYLTCADRLEGYYVRFGFRRLEPVEMPPYFRRLSRLTRALSAILRVFGLHWRILVMARPGRSG